MKTCLVVDDSRVVRKIACRILENLGLRAVEAEDGLAALASCRSAMPDLILLDSAMPTMSGIDFLKALRKEADGEKPTVLYCVTENDVAHLSEALAAGANDVLLKPFDKSGVQSALIYAGLVAA